MKPVCIQDYEEVCANCKHYYQHYTIGKWGSMTGQLFAMNCGHCTEPRVKPKNPAGTCVRFEKSA
jgi:hypothetical protein